MTGGNIGCVRHPGGPAGWGAGGPFLVFDPEYLAARGGEDQDASVMHRLSGWLEETIIAVPGIEAVKQELAATGMR